MDENEYSIRAFALMCGVDYNSLTPEAYEEYHEQISPEKLLKFVFYPK